MLQKLGFCIVIFLSNVIQGITGFAGTILAMPASLMLVGYPVAKPILNVLALLAGVLVFLGGREKCKWNEIKRMMSYMILGLFVGMVIKAAFGNQLEYLSYALAVFVLFLAIEGLWKMYFKTEKKQASGKDVFLLLLAGVVHGIFVSGGPLLVGYLTKRISEKESFRVTISFVWILLNSIVLVDDIFSGYWNQSLLVTQLSVLPFFAGGMYLGGRVAKRMNQRIFMVLTYVLLLVAGISLLLNS